MKQLICLKPVACLARLVANGELVAFNVGLDGVVYLAIAQKPLDYRTQGPGASFAKTIADQPQDYRVIGLRGSDIVLDVMIEGERFNIHDIQPLGKELLLVCCRSNYRGPSDFDKNGRVYSCDGKFERGML